MNLRQIADLVGVENYPEAMEEAFGAVQSDMSPACDLLQIDALQADYDMFGKYYSLVRAYAQKVNNDPAGNLWVKTAVRFAELGDFYQALSIPVPEPDGSQMRAMLPFYILVAQIPDSMAAYRQRGFSEAELLDLIKVYKNSLATVEAHTGLPGVNQLYYGWCSHFVKTQIFKVEGLQFEMRQAPESAIYIQNRENGEVLPIMCKGTIHCSGIQHIQSPGYLDAENAFDCCCYEDDEKFLGHPVIDCVVDPQAKAFPKSVWQCILRPGDPCLGMHIPDGADISPAAVDKAVAAAHRLVQERFPAFAGRLVFCSSWLLDPTLGKVLGEDARITQFQKKYTRYPVASTGKVVFGRVFPKNYVTLEQLPEDTRLQRSLKKLYLDGGYIYNYAGLII